MKYNTNKLFVSAYNTAKDYIIPFIEEVKSIGSNTNVLDVGCGEGGVIKAFLEKGCKCTGIDLMESRIKNAKKLLKDYPEVRLIAQDIYRFTPEDKFDIIILKDAIEHIPDKEKLLSHLSTFLKEDGIIWLGFPPIYMPFGGHQQIIPNNKLLMFMPYYHLLPEKLYKFILKIGKVPEVTIDELLEIKSLGLSIEMFEKIVNNTGYKIVKKRFYFFNPSYKYRFGFPVIKTFFPFNKIPYIRNFYIMGVYYIISK